MAEWSEKGKVMAVDSQAADNFGRRVAIYNNTMVVGADQEDGGAGDTYLSAGAAYVYMRSGASWTQVAQLTASNIQADHWFGRSVAISGDTIVVGASGNNGGAYIFIKPQGGWQNATEDAVLSASDAQANDQFGYSVAIFDDTIVVGARNEDGGIGDPLSDAGAAYVYTKPVNGWTSAIQDAKLTASDAYQGDYFGISVTISNNIVMVGAEGEDGGDGNSTPQSGAVYVFVKPADGVWVHATENAKLTASDAQSGDNFGYTVSLDNNTLVVGSHYEDGGDGDPLPTAGAAYVYTGTGASWNQVAILTASDAQTGDTFGESVTVSGNTIVVGAYIEDGGDGDPLNNTGAVYIFNKPASVWINSTEDQKIIASDAQADDFFGYSAAIGGNTLIVGAHYEDGGDGDPISNAGAAYIFTRPSSFPWTMFLPEITNQKQQ